MKSLLRLIALPFIVLVALVAIAREQDTDEDSNQPRIKVA